MAIQTTTTVKQTKRNLRVWIEGKKLSDSGFFWKVKYNRTIKNGVITFTVDKDGAFTTSGRNRGTREIAILDTSLQQLDGFTAGQEVTATFTANKIVIK